MADAPIYLLARADDAGSCHTANVAIAECVEAGLALNVGVMACCPFLEEAAEMLRGRTGICIGLHATINAEWDAVKWGPVLPPERVPALVDANGCFHQNPVISREHGAAADQVIAEIEAQLARLRAAGLRVDYLDEHMGFCWLAGVREGLDALIRREGLVPGRAPGLPPVAGSSDDPADALIARLGAVVPPLPLGGRGQGEGVATTRRPTLTPPSPLKGEGVWLVVAHPGHDTEEMRRLGHKGLAPGQVAREREGDTWMFTSPKVLAWCQAHGVVPARFTDLAPGVAMP